MVRHALGCLLVVALMALVALAHFTGHIFDESRL